MASGADDGENGSSGEGGYGSPAAAAIVRSVFPSLRFKFSNLLEDLGANDVIVLDGDSLLLECLSSARLDWRSGGAFLQVFAAIEHLLAGINHANAAQLRFVVVFFDCNAAVQPDAAARLARALLVRWLSGRLGLEVQTFSSWWTADWQDWLGRTLPALFILSDHPQAVVLGLAGDELAAGNGHSASEFAAPITTQRFMQAFLLSSAQAQEGMQCALLPAMRFSEQFVFAFRTMWRSGSVKQQNVVPAACTVGQGFVEQAAVQQRDSNGAFAVDLAALKEALMRPSTLAALNSVPPGGLRAALGAAACGAIASLAMGAEEPHLLDLFIGSWSVHELCCRHLQLPQRALQLREPPAPVPGAAAAWRVVEHHLQQFVHALHSTALLLLEAADAGAPAGTTASDCAESCFAVDASLVDWLDGRLLHLIVGSMWQGLDLGLSAAAQRELAELQESIQRSAGAFQACNRQAAEPQILSRWRQLGMLPLSRPATGAVSSQQVSKERAFAPASAPAHVQPVALLPMRNALVDGVMEGACTELTVYDLDSPEAQAAAGNSSTTFLGNFHYHTGAPLAPSDLVPAEREAVKIDLKGMSLEDMALSPDCSPYIRRRAAKMLENVKVLEKIAGPRLADERRWAWETELRSKTRNINREVQMYYRHQTTYAKSLDPTKFIRPSAPQASGSRANNKAGKQDVPGKKKEAKAAPSKADKIRAANTAKMAEKTGNTAQAKWDAIKKQLAPRGTEPAWTIPVAQQVDTFMAANAAPDVYVEAATWKLSVLIASYRRVSPAAGSAATSSAVSRTDHQHADRLAVAVWHTAAGLLQRKVLSPDGAVSEDKRLAVAADCQKALQLVGLADCAAHVAAVADLQSKGNEKKGKKEKKGKEKKDMDKEQEKEKKGISEKAAPSTTSTEDARFQLKHCGHLLPRDAPATSDPRVASFNPDPWQRTVLDAIDEGGSALIVAPTSSGKTFISQYCISSVVRNPDDKEGIAVFVAPTKALVNQVAAQVYKDIEDVICGIFTKDFRSNVETCRILVTVPACLELLLLGPTSQFWVDRIRYVILDEVHCMREVNLGEGGSRDGSGSTWEHILLLLRCPFLALSATIGNPGQFCDWLQSVKKKQKEQDVEAGRAPTRAANRQRYDVRLIQHTVRYSDLRLHTYQPATLEEGFQLPDLEQVKSWEGVAVGSGPAHLQRAAAANGSAVPPFGSLRRMHPLAVLQARDLAKIFPPELNLEPADVLDLHDAMCSALEAATKGSGEETSSWSKQAAASLKPLEPGTFFGARSSSPFITRDLVRVYESALKEELHGWSSSGGKEGQQLVSATLGAIAAGSYQTPAEHSPRLQDGAAFVALLLDLLAQDMLPTIAFNFERSTCEYLVEEAVRYLQVCEAQERERNVRKYAARRKAAEAAAKAAKAARDAKPSKRGEDEQREGEGLADVGWDEDAVLPEFSLAGRAAHLDPSEIEDLISSNAERDMHRDDPLVQGLRRGIGVHHGGLPKTYRQVVEILFRAGHLRVVVATGTLACGIHMPCRTVVFAGDHLFLSSLQFRQMMGRAGRRGFDPLGNVVFFGIGKRKICSLMVSAVPSLLGHFPITVSLIMRALALSYSVDCKDAGGITDSMTGGRLKPVNADLPLAVRDSLIRLFQRPYYAAEQGPAVLQKVQHLFRFSAEYLIRAGAVDMQGRPMGLSGMLCHLHWTDPANLALASLLNSGVLHKICGKCKPEMADDAFAPIAEQLLVIMSHLFQRLPLHSSRLMDNERIRASPSKVVLEPLPPAVQGAMDSHNSATLQLFVDYVRCYVGSLGAHLTEEQVLPLSGAVLPVGPAPADGSDAELWSGNGTTTSLKQLLDTQRVHFQVCSPFACLSGKGDEFGSVDELVLNVRSGILLDIAAVPTVTMTDRHGQAVPLNRFILDFFKHGQKEELQEANGVRESEAWQDLNSFKDIIRSVSAALDHLLPAEEFDTVQYAFSRLGKDFSSKFARFNGPQQTQRHGVLRAAR